MLGKHAVGLAALTFLAVMHLPGNSAHAQLLNQLNNAMGTGPGGGGSGGSALGGVGMPSVAQASPGNIGGVLQYCIRNNYLSGSAASSVKDSIVNKVPGGGASDAGFKSGNNGLLETGNGQTFGLGGSGIKAQMTHKVCDMALQHAKSML